MDGDLPALRAADPRTGALQAMAAQRARLAARDLPRGGGWESRDQPGSIADDLGDPEYCRTGGGLRRHDDPGAAGTAPAPPPPPVPGAPPRRPAAARERASPRH